MIITSARAVEENKLMQNSIYHNLIVLKCYSTSLLGPESKNTRLCIALKTGMQDKIVIFIFILSHRFVIGCDLHGSFHRNCLHKH